jgi:heptosyltransferase-2
MGKTLIGLNPGAAHGPAKRWSPTRLGHLVDGLQRPDWAFVSTAAPGEKHLNDEMQAATSVHIHRLGEQTSLRELPALISRLAILVTNDSGAMHVAAARKVPVVALFGPTDWPSTKPWQAPSTLVRHPVPCSPCFLEKCPIHHPCMDGIEAYAVAQALLDRMNDSNRWQAVI